MNYLKLTFIAGVLCLSSTNAFAGGKNDCASLMKGLLMGAKAERSATKVSTKKTKLIQEVLTAARAQEIPEDVVAELGKTLEGIKELPSKDKLEAYVIFLDTVRPKKQIEATIALKEFGSEKPESAFMKKFNKIQLSVDKSEANEFKKVQKRLAKENPDLAKEQLERLAKRELKDFRNKYEKLAYGCRARTWTPERKAAAQSFKKFTIGIGVASSIGGYTYANWDKEKDTQWFGKLGYELTWGVISGYLSSKIISNPANGPINIAVKGFLLSRANGLIDMGLYGALFSASDEEAQERLNKILNDPKKVELALSLKKHLEDKNVFQNFKDSVMKNFSKIGHMVGFKPPVEVEGIDWDNLTEEDLKREDVQNVLMAAVLTELYEEKKGKLINTGSIGSDRYAFHAMYGLLMAPKGVFMSLYIFNTLCLGQLNPQRALIKAIAIFTANKVISDQLYYWARRESINQ